MRRLLKIIRRIKKNNSANKGFSLVEILVAIAILSFSIIPIAAVFIASTKATSKSRTKLQATITADSVLEAAKAYSIYAFDTQCRLPNGSADFNLVTNSLAGKFTDGTFGVVNATYTDDNNLVLNDEPVKTGSFSPNSSQYAYIIKNIKQTKNAYDVIVLFLRNNMQTISVTDQKTGTTNSSYMLDTSYYKKYNWEYEIKVFVFKHKDSVSYKNKNVLQDSSLGYITMITGNKIDSAKTS